MIVATFHALAAFVLLKMVRPETAKE